MPLPLCPVCGAVLTVRHRNQCHRLAWSGARRLELQTIGHRLRRKPGLTSLGGLGMAASARRATRTGHAASTRRGTFPLPIGESAGPRDIAWRGFQKSSSSASRKP